MVSQLHTTKVLVLNRNWTAVNVVSLRRAIRLIASEYSNGEPKARVVDCTNDFQTMTWDDWSKLKPKEGEKEIRTFNFIIRVPEVIVLSKYGDFPTKKINFSRRVIYKRDNNTCMYCGCRPGTELLSIDHVLPKCQGGLTEWTNVVLACVKCNSRKADKSLAQAGMKLLKKPTKPKYNLFKGDYRVDSWSQFLGAAYWDGTLENDNVD